MNIVYRWNCMAAAMVLALYVSGCEQDGTRMAATPSTTGTEPVKTMSLTSSAMERGAGIKAIYTAEGDDISPPLTWSAAPAETKSFALICDDPDAPSPKSPADEPWVHWILFNIPPDVTELPQAMGRTPKPTELPDARQGANSWPSDNVGYRGPAPPPGSGPHRYFFKIYALDTTLDLAPGATKQQLLKAMLGHVLAEGQLMGTYER